MTRLKSYLLSVMLMLPLLSLSQRVSNVHFEQEGKEIIIYYDLQGKKNFNVKAFCSTNNGRSWGKPLQKLSGAIGNNQKAGNNKKIIWDVLSEREKLEGEIIFKIKATPAYKTYKSSFLPVFIPGARLKQYPGGEKRGGIRAVAFYGLMVSAVAFKISSNSQYNKYHKAITQEDMDKYYEKASSQNTMYQASLYLGLIVYGLDFFANLFKGFKPANNPVGLSYDIETRSMNLTYVYKF